MDEVVQWQRQRQRQRAVTVVDVGSARTLLPPPSLKRHIPPARRTRATKAFGTEAARAGWDS